MYHLRISEVGKPPQDVKVYGDDGVKRAAQFMTARDATEACRIIRMLRTDTAFKNVVVY